MTASTDFQLNDPLLLGLGLRTEEDVLKMYSRDWTTYFDTHARGVVFPKTTEEVCQLVGWSRKNRVPLIPSGGRTGLSGGACSLNRELVVSFDKMNQILEFDPVDRIVTIQAGVITEALQGFAREKGLFYPVDFAAKGSSQMGGNVATNAGGIRVIRYGMTRSWIAGLTVVTGTGETLHLNQGLMKNATGYDLRHLFIGSEGTLGFITEIQVQLTKSPPPSQVILLALPSLKCVMQVLEEFSAKTTLTAFEMFDQLSLTNVLQRSDLKEPFGTHSPLYVILEAEYPDPATQENILSAFETCLENKWISDGILAQSKQQGQELWHYRERISEALSFHSPYKNDISVRPSKVPLFIEKLESVIQREYPTWKTAWFGHIGDGNLHLNVLRPDGMSKEEFVKACRKVDELVFQTVQELQGSISAEHGVGLTKRDFLNYSRSEAEINLMRGLKKLFDPDGIINPGKLIS